MCDELEFNLKILNQIAEIQEYKWEVTKSNQLKKAIADKTMDVLLQRDVTEICFIYRDATGKEYCFVNQIKYSDYLEMATKYKQESMLAVRQIRRNPLVDECMKEHTIDKIIELRTANQSEYDQLSDVQVMKLTDALSKNYLKQILC